MTHSNPLTETGEPKMPYTIIRTTLIALCLASGMLVTGCVAVSRTPPLSHNGPEPNAVYHDIAFTSGTFNKPHQTLGVVQMTQEGFRNYLFGELNAEGTDSQNIMKAIASYVAKQGADGIQRFSLIAEKPRSREERGAQQVGQTLKIIAALADNNPEGSGSAAEGETTRFFVKGELVRWTNAPTPAPPSVPSKRVDVDELTE